eukprot:TRINITY_DN2503_c0_g1_i1.p1 TRINITY_DN2503_c0_g1~~TRINITY_DN2503_c0_g1_i1.p1  ORF type:complete len:293 (+),score=122.19 TRINITY_DN2503_c0_g1_i1:68-946(+)
MRALCFAASLAAAAAAQHGVDVHGMCAAMMFPSPPNKHQIRGRCHVEKLVRYVEADLPPFDDLNERDEVEGMLTDIWDYMCSNTSAMDGVECYSVVDAWSMIWTADGFPGRGLTGGAYDFAAGTVVTNLRKQSGMYSHYLFEREGWFFVAPEARGNNVLPALAANENVSIICSWGSAPLIQQTYAPNSWVCADNVDNQFEKLADGSASLIMMSATEFMVRSMDPAWPFIGVGDLQNLPFGETQENAMGFFFAKDNACALEKVNEALEEMMGTEWWSDLCQASPIPCIPLNEA